MTGLRRQYHFRNSERGVLAWDVHTLIELAGKEPVTEVDVSTIPEIDENWWYAHGQTPTVRSIVEHLRLIDGVDLDWPVILDPDGRLMDGMHRVARALREGRSTLTVRRLSVLPKPTFIGVAPEDLPYE